MATTHAPPAPGATPGTGFVKDIRKVAVLGSGVMGGAIAAHCANCGIPSIMLDIVPPDNPKNRNAIADGSKQAMLKAKPSPLYLKSNLDLIETGNFEDDMAKIADADWIVEVVKEDLAIKKKIFTEVAKHRKRGLDCDVEHERHSITAMTAVMDEDMKRVFLGTHFFNPPRYLKLLEIIPHADTDPRWCRSWRSSLRTSWARASCMRRTPRTSSRTGF
jgi:3-hydroxyacyl-CoA dehydrogenase